MTKKEANCDWCNDKDPGCAAKQAPGTDQPPLRPRTTELLCYEGDCAKMTGRARPCPVHDAQPPLPELTGHGLSEDDLAWCRRVREQYGNDSEKIVPRLFSAFERLAERAEEAGRVDATERAAREKAEEGLQKHRAMLALANEETERWARKHSAQADELIDQEARMQQAERERDEHKAAREKAEAQMRKYADGWQKAERELDVALARVKELEAHGSAEVQEHDETTAKLRGAESALASARELLERARAWLAWSTPAEPGPEPAVCLLNALESWFSSAPSPAPCSGCAAAREMLAATADGLEPTAPKSAAYIRSWLKEHSNG